VKQRHRLAAQTVDDVAVVHHLGATAVRLNPTTPKGQHCRHGPKPGVAIKATVLTLDNGPIHTSKAMRAALGERAHWLTIVWLPKCAPELTEIEEV
jgi:hypothetical protein